MPDSMLTLKAAQRIAVVAMKRARQTDAETVLAEMAVALASYLSGNQPLGDPVDWIGEAFAGRAPTREG